MWREAQQPGGGILADDMGLGKTLTLISLIIKSKELFQDSKENDDGDGDGEESAKKGDKAWLSKRSDGIIKSRGTLVVCPASLIGHWEQEVRRRTMLVHF